MCVAAIFLIHCRVKKCVLNVDVCSVLKEVSVHACISVSKLLSALQEINSGEISLFFSFFFFFVFFFPGRIFPTVHCRYLTESYHIRINICRRIDAYYRVTAGEFSQVLSHVCLCDIHAVYANLLKVIVARNSKVLIFQLIKFSLFVSVIFPTRFSLTNLLIFQNASCWREINFDRNQFLFPRENVFLNFNFDLRINK